MLTAFSCRLKGKGAHKAEKMRKELLQSDAGEEG